MERLDLVLNRPTWFGVRPEKTLRKLIDDTYDTLLKSKTATPTELVCAVIAKDSPLLNEKVVDGIRLGVCRSVVSNTICADFLDYIHRDYYHLGKPMYFDQRIFQYMELAKDNIENEDAFVISLGNSDRLRTDAITAIASLLDSRYQLSEIVIFHRTKCKAASMLERALQELANYKCTGNTVEEREASKDEWKKDIQGKLLDETDWGYLRYLLQQASGCESALRPIRGLLHRQLYQEIAVFPYREITPETHVQYLRDHYCISNDSVTRRLAVLRELESDYKLPEGSLAMYCPTAAMNAKIPKVRILVDDSVKTYEKWDRDFETALDGGHIHAQLKRFERMWRIQVTLDKSIYDGWSPQLRAVFHRSVKVLILHMRENSHMQLGDSVAQIANQLTLVDGSPYYKMTSQTKLAAKGVESSYLGKIPTIRSFFSETM